MVRQNRILEEHGDTAARLFEKLCMSRGNSQIQAKGRQTDNEAMSYLAVKTMHILSSAVLFGAGLGMGYFLWMAVRSRDPAVIADTLRQVIRAEWWFTIPMVIIQPITGVMLMDMLGYSRQSDWFRWVMGGYSLLGVVWLPVSLIVAVYESLANPRQELGPLSRR